MKIKPLIFLGFALLFASCGKSGNQEIPPQQVEVYETKADTVKIMHEFVGNVSGQKDIAIRARVQGFLEGIHFREGSFIKKGSLLYDIESQPYEADVASMMSKVAEAKTMLAKYESDLARIKPLAEAKAVSESELDAAVANYEAGKASVEAAKAGLRASRIYLSYTRVKAPISGIIGKTKAKVGDFVGQSPNPVILNTISLIDTMLVDFFITESNYLEIMRFLAHEYPEINVNGIIDFSNMEPSLELVLSDGTIHPHKGTVKFIDREVDPTTGAILVQAAFPNPEKILRPGLFAKIRSYMRVEEGVILIPQRCVMELQGIHSVYVVNSENKIEQRQVVADQKIGDKWLIKKGLVPGEKVVYEGLQKVRSGVTVLPQPIKNESLTNKTEE